MKQFTKYLAEGTKEPINLQYFPHTMVKVSNAKHAAQNFANDRMMAFEKWKNDNFLTSENGKLDYVKRFESKLRLNKIRFNLLELVEIFNNENNGN